MSKSETDSTCLHPLIHQAKVLNVRKNLKRYWIGTTNWEKEKPIATLSSWLSTSDGSGTPPLSSLGRMTARLHQTDFRNRFIYHYYVKNSCLVLIISIFVHPSLNSPADPMPSFQFSQCILYNRYL